MSRDTAGSIFFNVNSNQAVNRKLGENPKKNKKGGSALYSVELTSNRHKHLPTLYIISTSFRFLPLPIISRNPPYNTTALSSSLHIIPLSGVQL